MPPQPSAVARGHPPGCSVLPVSAGQRDSATHLIQDVLADELADRHESLRPLLVCVPGANLHWDRSAASNFLDILQTIRKTRVVTVTTVKTLVGPSAKRSHACALIARPRHRALRVPAGPENPVSRSSCWRLYPLSAESAPTRLCSAVAKLEMATSAGVVSCLGSGLWRPGTGWGRSASY